MAALHFLTLGVGDAFSQRHYSTSFALRSGDAWLLVDCPHPILKMLNEASQLAGVGPRLEDIRGVVLTHLHADHASGLEILGFHGRFVQKRRIPIVSHPDVFEKLWPHSLAGSMEYSVEGLGQPPTRRGMDDFFLAKPVTEERAARLGPFTIRCRRAAHSIPTISLRISAAGRTLGYSADTLFSPELLEWLAPADLILHEAAGGFMHTEYKQLLGVSDELQKRMRLVHYSDDFNADRSRIPCLRHGDWLEV